MSDTQNTQKRQKMTPEEKKEKQRQYAREHYLRVTKVARERKMQVVSLFDTVKEKSLAFIIIMLVPPNMMEERALIEETATSLGITDYDIDHVKRAAIKTAIHHHWYDALANRALNNYDTIIAPFNVADDVRPILRKSIEDFIAARDPSWIDSLMRDSLVTKLA